MKKFVKRVKKRIPWLEHVIEDAPTAREFSGAAQRPGGLGDVMCILCRGAKMLCGRRVCPVVARLFLRAKRAARRELEVYGSSPPDIFVGRFGYPYVSIGPLAPPYRGDTELLALTERWPEAFATVEEVVDARLQLIRGTFRADVRSAEKPDRLLELTQELALSRRPADVEMELLREPRPPRALTPEAKLMGASAPLASLGVEPAGSDRLLERVVSDDDLRARDAILELHAGGVPVSRIERVFSVGLLGLRGQRRLVPTRWSITAVDSIVSMTLRDSVLKRCELIDEFRVYKFDVLGNRFVVLMFPERWSYEFIEAWWPSTPWNPHASGISICGDYERYKGRTSYASIGGCYYACRLAVTEYLARERKQAKVLVVRESYPEYTLPLGVWLVREAVRRALRSGFVKFDSLGEALEHFSALLKIRLGTWIQVSELLREALVQRRIEDFIGASGGRREAAM